MIKINNGFSFVCFYAGKWALHFGVKSFKKDEELYDYHTYEYVLYRKGTWLWGRAIEPYDRILTYYGFGPVFCAIRFNGR